MASKAMIAGAVQRRTPYHASFSVGANGAVAQAPVDASLARAGENGSSGLGPGDSQYELTAITDGGNHDSSVEIPAFPPGSLDDRDTEDQASVESSTAEIEVSGPRNYRSIDSWGRLQFFTALGFAAVSLLVLGILLVSALLGGPILSSSTTALILGCVGTIAFLLLSLSATALIILLVDLARNVRQLSQQAERSPAGPHRQRRADRTKLSQPVG